MSSQYYSLAAGRLLIYEKDDYEFYHETQV
jgi:hypothetical protein